MRSEALQDRWLKLGIPRPPTESANMNHSSRPFPTEALIQAAVLLLLGFFYQRHVRGVSIGLCGVDFDLRRIKLGVSTVSSTVPSNSWHTWLSAGPPRPTSTRLFEVSPMVVYRCPHPRPYAIRTTRPSRHGLGKATYEESSRHSTGKHAYTDVYDCQKAFWNNSSFSTSDIESLISVLFGYHLPAGAHIASYQPFRH